MEQTWRDAVITQKRAWRDKVALLFPVRDWLFSLQQHILKCFIPLTQPFANKTMTQFSFCLFLVTELFQNKSPNSYKYSFPHPLPPLILKTKEATSDVRGTATLRRVGKLEKCSCDRTSFQEVIDKPNQNTSYINNCMFFQPLIVNHPLYKSLDKLLEKWCIERVHSYKPGIRLGAGKQELTSDLLLQKII